MRTDSFRNFLWAGGLSQIWRRGKNRERNLGAGGGGGRFGGPNPGVGGVVTPGLRRDLEHRGYHGRGEKSTLSLHKDGLALEGVLGRLGCTSEQFEMNLVKVARECRCNRWWGEGGLLGRAIWSKGSLENWCFPVLRYRGGGGRESACWPDGNMRKSSPYRRGDLRWRRVNRERLKGRRPR